MKRSLIIGCPTPVRNSYPGDILCFKFHLFYFLGIQSVKSLNALIFHTKKGFSLRKIPTGCSKVKPFFQLDAFFGEILKRTAVFLRCHFEVPFEHFDKMAQAVVTARRGNFQDAHIRRTEQGRAVVHF